MNSLYHTPQPQRPAILDSVRRFLRKVLLVILAALAAAGGIHLYRKWDLSHFQQSLWGTEASRAAADTPKLQPLSNAWVRQDVAEMSLEAPVTLIQYKASTKGLPAEFLQQVVYQHNWGGKAEDGFQVEVVSYMIDGTHTLSLEDAAMGAIRTFAAAAGDSRPVFRKTDGWVNGLAARRISYERTVKGKTWHLEGTVVQNRRQMLGVAVIFTGETRKVDAERVLRSLHIQTAK